MHQLPPLASRIPVKPPATDLDPSDGATVTDEGMDAVMRDSATATSWAVVLAGGVGSRFWPVSTPARPKQLLPLAGDAPMIRQTVERILPLVPVQRIRILTGRALADPILNAVPGLSPEHLLLEPAARGTAPVLAWAAHTIAAADPDGVMLSLHSDHVIEPAESFRAVLARAADVAARHQRLVTLGVVPTRPDTGYGYIAPGEPLDGEDARIVQRFVEKPDRATAEAYIDEGCLWNTGIFIWPARLLLDELRQHTPEVAQHFHLLDGGDVEGYFAAVPSLSIDEGLLERSRRVAVLRARFSWDDVGTWDAVGRTRTGDVSGNVAVGDAAFVDAERCIAWSEQGRVVIFGGTDLVVVHANDTTFVAPRERTADLKQLIAELDRQGSLRADEEG
jgi:mannose-1-phosphate guanylyltransferase